jgi:hypothetical protein
MILYIQKRCHNVKEGKTLNISKKVEENRQSLKVEKQEDVVIEEVKKEEKPIKVKSKKNKEENIGEFMDENKLKQAEELVNALSGVDPNQIKRIKSDRGLIERTESSKVILTEDNRQILND